MRNANPFLLLWASLHIGMPDDVLLNKSQIIRRCIARIHEEYAGDPANLTNLTKQDSITVNLLRA